MDANLLPSSSSSPISFILIFIFFLTIPQKSSGFFNGFSACSNRFICGNLTNVGYPFWGDGRPESCGYPHLHLNCERNIVTTIEIMNVKYQVLKLNLSTQILKIARADFLNGSCPSTESSQNPVFDSALFEYAQGYGNLTILYDCSSSGRFTFCPVKFHKRSGRFAAVSYRATNPLRNQNNQTGSSCSKIIVGVSQSYNSSEIKEALRKGFEVKYEVDNEYCNGCTGSGGVCGYESMKPTCYCENQSYGNGTCITSVQPSAQAPAPAMNTLHHGPFEVKAGSSLGRNSVIGIGAAIVVNSILAIVIVCFYKRECLTSKIAIFWKKDRREEFDVDAFLSNYGSFASRRYSYSNIKKMTNSFVEPIGKGGFGTVYKGKLHDGHPVAVKVLNESKGNGQEFINEVVSIGRTSHVNIITLLGFCYERTKRVLIYEYMANGSLDKFIFNKDSLNLNSQLDWKKLYDIAVGIARGLEYLHRGCGTRILHFDIKPQNILLDNEFCPKISDFGLAKLSQTKESIVSMMGARGTPGYIAPEVWSKNFGGASYKSDVYSYGMMVLEMVGGRKNIQPTASHTSQIYYPDWIYEDLELDKDLRNLEVKTEEEKEITRKMVLVSFWCIQINPLNRPSMSKVVEMLQGSLQSLQIPPKPILFSENISHELAISIHSFIFFTLQPLHEMNSKFYSFPPSPLLLPLILPLSCLLLFINFPPCWSLDMFTICSKQFSCGNISGIDYPFWGGDRRKDCGLPHLHLLCDGNLTTIQIMGIKYKVLDINQKDQILKISRNNLVSNYCSPNHPNTTFDPNQFQYAPDSREITILYDCPDENDPTGIHEGFNCPPGSAYKGGFITIERQHMICNGSLKVGFLRSYLEEETESNSAGKIEKALREGFGVKYKMDNKSCLDCTKSRGACGYDLLSNQTTCYCDGYDLSPRESTCPFSSSASPSPTGQLQDTQVAKSSLKRHLVIGILVAGLGLLIICSAILIFYIRNCRKDKTEKFDVEAFIRNYASLSPRRYSYTQVKRMTNSFADSIGKGGFGSVYKGKLPDGRIVAVKVLKESETNSGEDFINEVVSMGRTSHVNIVTLFGFCYEGTKRALIYDYMPNGSLDKFIFDQESLDATRCLEWKTLYEISLGIAQGLEYLHRGCNTRILHFDIKPQNILLDKDFCPKISDFGLAKLWLNKESIASVMSARGTAGYIAPEVFSRNFGGVSHKSDVYSYGMLVLEMVGGRKNMDPSISHTSGIYFPCWIYEYLKLDKDLRFLEVKTEEEEEMSRKMVLVSFWCIQINPSHRPPMSKVVEMLEGNLESVPIPPKPFLFSPPRSPQHSTSLSTIEGSLAESF
ncbi:uncharacterized protein LOC107423140 [Ziziphus jujuba]|uniref:non-specific serine/threonine protein kinase n=1 Tax=Ziziphus jujuba TaxID=326968 RepID=A0ABM4A6S9_ZIZJJ|nr:uncharacterized protein LOC107423140 [Ziziphus jujuba]